MTPYETLLAWTHERRAACRDDEAGRLKWTKETSRKLDGLFKKTQKKGYAKRVMDSLDATFKTKGFRGKYVTW